MPLLSKDRNVVNMKNRQGNTPLHLSAQENHVQVSYTLLKMSNPDLEKKNGNGKRPFDVSSGETKKYLLGAMQVEKDAKKMAGVAVTISDKSFMANKDIFLKHGYNLISESGKAQLLAKQFREGPSPSINDWQAELAKHNGLTIVYSKQCPWVARFIEDVKPILEEKNLKPTIIELKTAAQAQKAPSLS